MIYFFRQEKKFKVTAASYILIYCLEQKALNLVARVKKIVSCLEVPRNK